MPHPEERRLRRVSKDERAGTSWFETAQVRLLTTRNRPSDIRARLVDRQLVWLGFSACSSCPAMTKLRQGRMLFNSYQFIFLFLPITLIGYFVLVRLNRLAPVIWLALASLVFYSVSNWQFVLLLLASVAFNYVIGGLLFSKPGPPPTRLAALPI